MESSVKSLGFNKIHIFQPPSLIRQPELIRPVEEYSINFFQIINKLGFFLSLKPLAVKDLAIKITNESLTNKIDQITTNIYDQGFYYYTAKNSGPWMLRPDQTKAEDAIPVSDKAQLSVIKSSTNEVIEVVQIFDDWITQTIRLVDDIFLSSLDRL